jgi:Domain of unknown function (DUF1905)/Bacteriocin-protection, YdeI or OmpD-Associated
MSEPVTFRATLLLGGKTATGIKVPPEAVEALGAGRQPKVRATINGHTYRSSVASRGGDFLLPVSAEVRGHAGVDPEAKEIFERLAYSHQLRYVLWIDEAKKPETRQRRVAQTLVKLREG